MAEARRHTEAVVAGGMAGRSGAAGAASTSRPRPGGSGALVVGGVAGRSGAVGAASIALLPSSRARLRRTVLHRW